MKTFKNLICLILVLIVFVIPVTGCVSPGKLNYTPIEIGAESVERLSNPGIGFYRTLGVKLTETGGSYGGFNRDNNLHHIRVDIGQFSFAVNNDCDKEISDLALEKLDELLTKLEQNEKTAIIRFAYDGFNGKANCEPSKEMITRHIEQLSVILNKHTLSLVAIEAGLVGPWGEMHTSTLANKEVINEIISSFLTHTTLPVLVRTPKMIYNYLGITLNDLDTYTISASSSAYRLGLFNDGYLANHNDLGTYSNRELETLWLSKQTNHLPFGGEVAIYSANDTSMSNIENCLEEMELMNLSYLNYEWNYTITQEKWKNTYFSNDIKYNPIYNGQTAQTYIENHMGYRFVMKNAQKCISNNKLYVKFTIDNVGFSDYFKTANSCLMLVDGNNNITTFETSNFTGAGDYAFDIALPQAGQNYTLYYAIYYQKQGDTFAYPIAIANNDMYDKTLKANKLCEFSI